MHDPLIDQLSRDLQPVPRGRLRWRLFGVATIGIVISALWMMAWLGPRPDMLSASRSMMFWSKFAFTAIFLGVAALAALNLSRPGGKMLRQAMWLVGLLVIYGALGIVQMLVMGPGAARQLIMGGSALICPLYIVALAAPIYAAAVFAMRGAAPTKPALAGFAAGLFAGAAGTFVYAFHCIENGMPFVTIWYTLGIFICAVLGAVVGRWVLRW